MSNQWLLITNNEDEPMSLQFPTITMSPDYRRVETSDEAVEFIVRMLRQGSLVRDWPFILAKATKDLHDHDTFDSERKMDARDNDRTREIEWRKHNDC